MQNIRQRNNSLDPVVHVNHNQPVNLATEKWQPPFNSISFIRNQKDRCPSRHSHNLGPKGIWKIR